MAASQYEPLNDKAVGERAALGGWGELRLVFAVDPHGQQLVSRACLLSPQGVIRAVMETHSAHCCARGSDSVTGRRENLTLGGHEGSGWWPAERRRTWGQG